MAMSKMGNWVFEMQETATDLTLSEFVERYGHYSAPVWYEQNFATYEYEDEPLEAQREGFYGS
jgi:hypothetical protein